MATHNIGPGQTYETFAALIAAVTLAPDDIVDNGDKLTSAGDKYSEIQIVCRTNGEAIAYPVGGVWSDTGA